MLKMSANFVLGRLSSCDVAQGYVAVATRPAASLDSHFEHSLGWKLNPDSKKSGRARERRVPGKSRPWPAQGWAGVMTRVGWVRTMAVLNILLMLESLVSGARKWPF